MAGQKSAKDALLLARAALHGAGEGLSPKVFALFQERIAWAAAQIGDATTICWALGQVDEALDLAGGEPEPHFVYWLNRDEADVMAARCHLRLGDANRATALLRPAIDRYPEGHHREKALYLSWLAEAHMERGDRDAASTIIEEIEELNVDSHRVSARLAAMT